MKQRIDVGTDVARVGVWDASCADDPLPELGIGQLADVIAEDAKRGRVFLLQLGGDWGGSVDVYVDSSVCDEHSGAMERLPGKFLVSAPTGQIVVGGAEDYRRAEPGITSESSVVELPVGDYSVECYELKSGHHEYPDGPSFEEVKKDVGAEAYEYYERFNKGSSD
ncbi:MAG: hypothetical protein DHS20C11_01090 [Lysobacteraceae bacterium]|nr:MAG: hypothetical protein DHS20C11_01090 [Xanthomonadaceae bacterium]